ncbi:sugar ABC transporter ATP-binding protein [Actinomyces vulturis]|uniref:sugar ABC transporter ATP-binding protein n=1 Tax=Actinomyces vulturis TaxID=1857645 RepID=UPI0008312383|nr:sugar ABC transporter ATP-binding protein [Actinomyces vulturis]
MVNSHALLHAEHVSKAFPGVQALDDVSFTLQPGQVHALVGENGAGKSTLMKIIGGIYHADSGHIVMDGTEISPQTPGQAHAHGIAVIHQELSLAPHLSIEQNICLGREPRKSGPLTSVLPHATRLIDRAAMRERAIQALDQLGLKLDPSTPVGHLSVAAQQMVEIARSLSMGARILIMDEPTAALTGSEVERLFGVINNFVSPTTGVIYISHRMEEIKRMCQAITVMRDGKTVATFDHTPPTADIIAAMVGRHVDTTKGPSTKVLGDVRLSISHLQAPGVRDASLDVRGGEIVGLAGLMGAGRTEVARAVVGADPMTSGTITLHGKEVRIPTPAHAAAQGIGYLTEDRKVFGLLLDKDVTENIALASYKTWSKAGFINDSNAREVAVKYVSSLRIKTPSVDETVANLSGGNQQKVALARWLVRDCDVLIVDEPTRGIDVGAKDEIYTLLESLAAQGKAIVIISSEIPELQRLADRIVVMCEGRTTGELSHGQATGEAIMELATQFDHPDTPLAPSEASMTRTSDHVATTTEKSRP